MKVTLVLTEKLPDSTQTMTVESQGPGKVKVTIGEANRVLDANELTAALRACRKGEA